MQTISQVLRRCAALGAAALIVGSSCTIHVRSGELDENDDWDGVEEAEPCEELNVLPEEDVAIAVERARQEFEASGRELREIWTSPELFDQFFRSTYRQAGCELPTEPPGENSRQSALHADYGPDYYCGPGHGMAGLFNLVPEVPECLNNACRRHDACYARCSFEPESPCIWDSVTQGCDTVFLNEAAACMDDSHRFTSFVVRLISGALDSSGDASACESERVCPGRGPCALDRKAARAGGSRSLIPRHRDH